MSEEIQKKISDYTLTQILEEFCGVLGIEYKEIPETDEEIEVFQNELYNLIIKELKEKEVKEDEKEAILNQLVKFKQWKNRNDPEGAMNKVLPMFIEDIYKDSFHFFLELIQNADDASKGNNGDKKELTISITEDNNIVFEYNDRGFNYIDLFAITSFGNSTKKEQLKDDADIGEKGIGFKSIFAVASKVGIESKFFNFDIEYDNKKPSSILVPKIKHGKSSDGKTKLTLFLSKEFKEIKKTTDDNIEISIMEEIKQWLQNSFSNKDLFSPFLFLKNIEKISYSDDGKIVSVEIERKDIKDIKEQFGVVTIRKNDEEINEIKETKYIRYSQSMKFGKDAIISRWKHLESELKEKEEGFTISRPMEICFPLYEENTQHKGRIYSYLPTNIELDLPIFINLDVHLTASRGNISKDDFKASSVWNSQVKEQLPKFLEDSYLEIIKTQNQDSELFNQEELKELREVFYKYLPNRNTGDNLVMYADQFTKFSEEILEKNIILSNNNEFLCKDEIHSICISLNKYTKEEYKEFKKEFKELYNFLNNCTDLSYAKTVQWNDYLRSILDYKSLNALDILENQGGIRKYWILEDKDEESKKRTIEAVIKIIIEHLLGEFEKLKETNKDFEIIPLEEGNGFKIVSFNEIKKDNKSVFFHSEKDDVEEDRINAVYIYEKVVDGKNTYGFKRIEEILKKVYDIYEYNLKEYFKKQVETLTNSNVRDFINATFKFYKQDNLCYTGLDSNLGDATRRIMQKRVISIEDLNNIDFGTPLKNIHGVDLSLNREYITALAKLDNTTIKKWSVPLEYNKEYDIKSYLSYLMFLGIKCELGFANGNLDDISLKVLPTEQVIEFDSKNRIMILNDKPLVKYFLDKINGNINGINKENVENICSKMNIFKLIFTPDLKLDFQRYEEDVNGKIIPKSLLVLENDKIEALNKGIDELNQLDNKYNDIKLTDGKFFIINNIEYEEIWNKLKVKNITTDKSDFMTSYLKYEQKEFIKTLRMLNLLNKTFIKEYRNIKNCYHWSKPYELTLEKFLSCANALKTEGLYKLMQGGFELIDIDANAVKYFGGAEEVETLKEFLKYTKILEEDINFEEIFIADDKSKMDVDFINLNTIKDEGANIRFNNNVHYIIKYATQKSKILLSILEARSVKKSTFITNEIKIYFDEWEPKNTRMGTSNFNGHSKFCEGVFFHYQKENIEYAEPKIRRKFDENNLNILYQPFRLKEKEVMEGYGFTCPICGTKSKSGLNGLKYDVYKNGNENSKNKYLYIVSCLNCREMLRTSKNRVIENLDEIVDRFETCYCADNDHIKNHAKMQTVNISFQTCEGKTTTLQMKISYLNMCMYYYHRSE